MPSLTPGTTIGTLSDAQLTARYHLQGVTGDSVEITVLSDDFDPYLLLLDGSGIEMASDDDCVTVRQACIGPLELPSDGAYTVVVESFDRRSTGTFNLMLEVETAVNPTLIADSSTTPLPSECPAAVSFVVITTDQSQINLREGPDVSRVGIGYVYDGECFEAIGRNQGNTWLKIRTNTGRTGWVLASFTVLHGNLQSLPVLTE
jgi:hypothetical protein